jgi:hypothetical protein
VQRRCGIREPKVAPRAEIPSRLGRRWRQADHGAAFMFGLDLIVDDSERILAGPEAMAT